MEFLRESLPNGLEIVAERNQAAYTTALGFFVRTGARDESDQTAGVSHFLEHMAFKGTTTRSADEVNRQFDELGAHYNAFTSEEHTVYYAAVLPEQQDDVVELLSDILRPALREEDFQTERQVILEEIHMYEDQPPFGADEQCKAAHYGPHPLGHRVLGTTQSVTALTAEAMRQYFHSRYTPGNIILAAAGRVDFEALVTAARRHCGPWEPTPATRDILPADPQPGFHVVEKPSAVQQYTVLLAPGPSATDPDRYAAKILATVIGDDTGSRLFWELVDPGLAEQAGITHHEYDGSGLFMTYLGCDPQHAETNLQRILDIYRQAEGRGITPEELDQAKNKVASRLVLAGEHPRGRLFALGGDWIQRRTYRSIRNDLEAVKAITLDEIHHTLARCPLSRNTTVTVGPLAEIQPPK